jgi:uncharacterized membrane protein/Mg-chelatase subunit ChlD
MFDHSLAFGSRSFLLLLACLPFLWWWSRKSLPRLGRGRGFVALGLRSLAAVLLILAMADIQLQRQHDRLTVIYLLDQSLSIPSAERRAMIDYVNRSIDAQRSSVHEDRVGVLIFGRDAAVEIPPVDFNVQIPHRIETQLDPEKTNLAAAIGRAKAMFPYDTAKRIVLVTDGNQNLGDGLLEARKAAAAGVSIDVLPVMLRSHSEVAVEKIDLPTGVRRGQPFNVRVVLRCDLASKAGGQPVTGKLRLVRKAGETKQTLSEQEVRLHAGKQVFTIPEEITRADFYTYEAHFTADHRSIDRITQNNLATAFTHVQGQGQVLLIENWDRQGEFDHVASQLRQQQIEVTLQSSDHLFTSLAGLQRFDCVLLANVARSSGDSTVEVCGFSDSQIRMLVRNTHELGCGLIMIGGPDGFGAGGWTGTEIEAAMPVDFQIKDTELAPSGALVLMMHAGEMPKANYWQKRIAYESIQLLGDDDYCGLIRWQGTDRWLWEQSTGGLIPVGPSRKMMLAKVDQMTIGDMPSFDPAVWMAAAAMDKVKNATVKHMIVISDGDPTPPTPKAIRELNRQGIKVSTVAVGSHGLLGSQPMQEFAQQTGGVYYVVKNAAALPKIFQRETRRVSKPLRYQLQPAISPQVVMQHEIVQGLGNSVPPIRGFVLTSVKPNPLVEVILRSPKPVSEQISTILAIWTYGAGRVAALTTDAGQQWAVAWDKWEQGGKFFSQLVGWAMRQKGTTDALRVATDKGDGRSRIIITSLDENDSFADSQLISATVIAPDMSTHPVRVQQTAPGRYVGTFPTESSGSYLITVHPGPGKRAIRTGLNVGYSAEYLDRETNLPLLETIAGLVAHEGEKGALMAGGLDVRHMDRMLESNPFRRDLPLVKSNRSIWPAMVLLASCTFLADLFFRRVRIRFPWLVAHLSAVRNYLLQREQTIEQTETLSRLRSRKAEVADRLEGDQQATRGKYSAKELAPEKSSTGSFTWAPAEPDASSSAHAPTRPAIHPHTVPPQSDEPLEETTTERLLKAKKRIRHDQDKSDKE